MYANQSAEEKFADKQKELVEPHLVDSLVDSLVVAPVGGSAGAREPIIGEVD